MHTFRTMRYILLGLTAVVPLAYLVFIRQGVNAIAKTWGAFHDLCIASGAAFVNYFFIHNSFASLFMILIASIGLIWALVYCIRQIYYLQRLQTQLLAKKDSIVSGSNGTTIVINDDRLFALTVGFLKPRIYLSSRLKQVLSENELACVTAHEQYHRRNYDSLFSLILETVSRLLFFLPFMRYIVKHAHLWHELAADHSALQNSSTDTLASAILKTTERQEILIARHGVALGFSTLSERVTYLLNPKQKPVLHFSWLSIVWSMTMVVFVLLAATSLGTRDIHAQTVSAPGQMSQAIIEHCKAEDFTYFSLRQSLSSEANMSASLKY